MVNEARRQTGGQSNRKGNRYEDAFAVFRSIQLAPDVIQFGRSVRLREQAACPVDDLVIRHESCTHYYQLKDRKAIAWSWHDENSARSSSPRWSSANKRQEDSTLTIVVSDADLKQSLERDMPVELKETIDAYHFPAAERVSELVQRRVLQDSLHNISAMRSPGRSLLHGLVEGFELAWLERERDEDGETELGQMVRKSGHENFRAHCLAHDS